MSWLMLYLYHTLWWLWSTRPPIMYTLLWSKSAREKKLTIIIGALLKWHIKFIFGKGSPQTHDVCCIMYADTWKTDYMCKKHTFVNLSWLENQSFVSKVLELTDHRVCKIRASNKMQHWSKVAACTVLRSLYKVLELKCASNYTRKVHTDQSWLAREATQLVTLLQWPKKNEFSSQ